MQQPGHTPTGSKSTRLWPAAIAVVLMVLIAGAAAFTFALRSADGGTSTTTEVRREPGAKVRLEPVTYQSAEPFTESVITADPAELGRLATTAPSVAGGAVSGDTALLYRTRRSRPVCNVARLAQLVTSDDAVRASWAAAAGVDPGAVEHTVLGFTPVVLTADTAVTNHVYRSGSPVAYQSVLQRGTPVLIDRNGQPRAQCSCGNPLLQPDVDRSAEYDGERWADFQRDDVIQVTPADEPADQVTTLDIDTDEQVDTSIGGLVALDGLLVTTRRGVDVVDAAGVATTVIDRPVRSVFDDGDGGLVYTLARPSADRDGDGYEDGPPDDAEDAAIWHLPAGASEASELVGVEADGGWNDLLGVGQLGDRTFVVFAPLTVEQVYEEASTPAGPVVAMDLMSAERTVLLEGGFGWEARVGAVSFGGERLAMEDDSAISNWLLFDADLRPVPNACSSGDGTDEALYEFVDQNCPYQGALNDDGNLVFFGSALADGPVVAEDETIETLDLISGAPLPSVKADFLADTQETPSTVTQARDEMLVAEFTLRDGPTTAEVLSTVDGTFVEFPDDAIRSARGIWVLASPIVRPVASEGDQAAGEEQAPHPDIDAMNMTVPAGACPTQDDSVSPSVKLTEGSAQTSADYASEDFVSFTVTPEAVTWVDLDEDGTDELVVSVMCNWGGSGWGNSVLALTVAEDGSATMVAEPLADYGIGGRSADALRSDELGVVTVSGSEWIDEDANCCPSSTFTADWSLIDGEWIEL